MKRISFKSLILGGGLSLLLVSGAGVAIGEGVNFAIQAKKNEVIPPEVIEYIDETELTEGLMPHYFEAENAVFTGNSCVGSEEYDHACAAVSLMYHHDMHGGAAIRNINNNSMDVAKMSKLTFNITSDKNVECKMDLRMSIVKAHSMYENQTTFSELMILNVNGQNNAYNGVPQTAGDQNLMTIVTPTVKLMEGENVITISLKKHHPYWVGVIDYINIMTTANLSYEPYQWSDYNLEVDSFPTMQRVGNAVMKCKHCERINSAEIPNISQGLESGLYISKPDSQDTNKTNYYLSFDETELISSDPLPKIEQFKLEIIDPARATTFVINNGDYYSRVTSTNVWVGHALPEIDTNIINYHVSQWVDATNHKPLGTNETFVMQKRDMKITPVYAPNELIHNKDNLKEGGIDLFSSSTPGEYKSYKPFHSGGPASKGFSYKTLTERITRGIVYSPQLPVEGAIITYDSFSAGDGFTICADLFYQRGYKIEMEYRLQNNGTTPLKFVLNNTNASSQAIQEHPTNGKTAEVTLNPNESKIVVISMTHISNSNTLTGFRFLTGASKLNLGVAMFVRQQR